jgi:hypothetical protein
VKKAVELSKVEKHERKLLKFLNEGIGIGRVRDGCGKERLYSGGVHIVLHSPKKRVMPVATTFGMLSFRLLCSYCPWQLQMINQSWTLTRLAAGDPVFKDFRLS